MYFDMSASTFNKITHLKSQIFNLTGISVDLTSEDLCEDLFNTIYEQNLNQLATIAHELLMDLKENNTKKRQMKVLGQYDKFFIRSKSVSAA